MSRPRELLELTVWFCGVSGDNAELAVVQGWATKALWTLCHAMRVQAVGAVRMHAHLGPHGVVSS
jgi:hypothetical protein